MTGPVSETQSPLDLGAVFLEASKGPHLLTLDEPLPPDADLFLGEALSRLEKEGGLPRLLLVATEGSPREAGLVALGLARVAAGRGMRVLLADFAVDSPVLAKPFPYQPEEGFVDMVLWGSSFPAVLRKTRHEKIGVVCVGSPPPDPDLLLEEPECDAVLGTMRGECELVVAIGRLRTGRGAPSPLLRRADRTLIVRGAGQGVPDLQGHVPADRLLLITLGEETPSPRPASPPERPPVGREGGEPARERGRRRIPLVRLGLLFAGLCIVVGVVLSGLYMRSREDAARARIEVARRESPTAGRAVGEEAPMRANERALVPETTAPSTDAEEAPTAATTAPSTAGESEGAAPLPAPPVETRPPQEEAKPRPTPQEGAGAAYGVHVESFPTPEDAERGAVRFRESGERVTIVEKEIPEKGIWYRVVLGRFATSQEANAHAEELKETLGISYALVVRLSP